MLAEGVPVTSNKVDVLDFGYVRFIEHWGSDERVIESARMSTSGSFKGWGGEPCPECFKHNRLSLTDSLYISYTEMQEAEKTCKCKGTGVTTGDEKLLKYLWTHGHYSPFEFGGITVEVQAPIFVFRQWFRHRTLSPNEMSGRYTVIPNMFYIPSLERLMMGADGINKQAGTIKDSIPLTKEYAEYYRGMLGVEYARQEILYEQALKNGIPKELARAHLATAQYSRARIIGNLRNILVYLDHRSDFTDKGKEAQWEIRQFSNVLGQFVQEKFPRTFKLFLGDE